MAGGAVAGEGGAALLCVPRAEEGDRVVQRFPLPGEIGVLDAVAGDVAVLLHGVVRSRALPGAVAVGLNRVGSGTLEDVGGKEGEVVVRPGCPVLHVVALRAEGVAVVTKVEEVLVVAARHGAVGLLPCGRRGSPLRCFRRSTRFASWASIGPRGTSRCCRKGP